MFKLRVISFAVSCCVTGLAAADPVVIDSGQKATAALTTGFTVLSEPALSLWSTVDQTRRVAETALTLVSGSTTPAALLKKPAGITIPCAISGSATAQLARTFPRVLKLRWNACLYTDFDGYPRERNGSTEITLLSDTFTPERIAGIRQGSAGSDFTETRTIIDPEQNSYSTWSVNLRIVGLIPMVREFPRYGLFVGPYAFEMSGFYRGQSRYELPDPQEPTYESDSVQTYEYVIACGANAYSNSQTQLSEDLTLHWGTFERTTQSTGWPADTTRFSVQGLRVRSDSEFVNWTRADRVDGSIDYHWSEVFGPSCLSGEYRFKTVTPLSRSMFDGNGALTAGDLRINGSTRAQFFSAANTPPSLPVPQNGMLAHVTIAGVGEFDYDVAGPFFLRQISGCW